MKLTLLLTISLLTLITACSSGPKHIVVSPELIGFSKGVYFDNKIQLNSIDQRSANHVLQIITHNQPAKLLSSQNNLTNIINQAIEPVLRKQGITVDQFSNTRLEIIIDTALINVQQDLLNYKATNTISLIAKVHQNNKTLTKTFKTKGQSKGPLTADIAVLERDFNNQLASTLVKITNDLEIQNAIRNN